MQEDLKNDWNFIRLAQEGETCWQDIFNRFKRELLKRCPEFPSGDLDWLIDNVYALPNSPALLTAGSPKGFYASACSSYPIFDTMRGSPFAILDIESLANDATVAGIGVGFNFSQLRGKQEGVRGRKGVTGGPTSFLRKMSGSLGEITQATRKSACMGSLSVHHPDILDFIKAKSTDGAISNFNISISASDEFMAAVRDGTEYTIKPMKGDPYKASAKEVFDAACFQGWKLGGEPGWIFCDNIINDYFSPSVLQEKSILLNPCQPEFATILTPEGIRTIGEIGVGSIIWSGKRWTKVTAKWCTGDKPVFEYETPAGVFIGTENHKIIHRGLRVEVGQAEGIDYCICPSSFEDFDPQDIMDGLMIGDGSIHKASGNLKVLYIGDKDGDYHTSEISHLIGRHRPGVNPRTWEIDTTISVEELGYTYDRVIPDRFYKGNNKTKASFLRGLFTANGCATAGRIQYKGASKRLVQQVQEMLSSLGIRSSLVINKPAEIQHKNGKYTSKESYNLILYRDSCAFMEKIGFIQKYKNDAPLHEPQRPEKDNKIRKVSSLGTYKVYDITVEAGEHTYWTGGLLVSNCAEAILSYGSEQQGDQKDWLELCALASINLPKYVNMDAAFRRRIVRTTVLMLNALIDSQDYVSELHRIGMQKMNRKIGIGYAGVATVLAVRGHKYSSPEGRQLMADIQKEISQFAIEASASLGDVNGLGRYNSSLFSIAPTSTLSNIFNHFNEMGCSYGCEPYFEVGEYTVTNSYGTFKKKDKISECLKDKISHIEVANDLPWKDHVAMVESIMKAAPKGTFMSISKTINFRNNVSLEEYKECVMHCWSHGLKGITVYRDGSRKGQVISTDSSYKSDRPETIEYHSAPKRPVSLPCDIHHTTYKGKKWIVLVGLLEGRPYEVFAGLEENLLIPKKHKTGAVVMSGKKGNKIYSLHVGEGDDESVVHNIPKTFQNEEFGTLTKITSYILRHGAPPWHFCELLNKTEEFSSFLRILARVLKKYVPDETTSGEKCTCGASLRYVQGCLVCPACGSSKCG